MKVFAVAIVTSCFFCNVAQAVNCPSVEDVYKIIASRSLAEEVARQVNAEKPFEGTLERTFFTGVDDLVLEVQHGGRGNTQCNYYYNAKNPQSPVFTMKFVGK
jgi:hypothetical protein